MTRAQWATRSPHTFSDGSIDPRYNSPAVVQAVVVASILLAGVVITKLLQSDTMQGIGQLALHRANKIFKAGNGGLSNGYIHDAASNGDAKDVQDNLDAEDGSNVTYPGLVNTSTTCYLNSTLQSLASCPSFVAYLTSLVESSDIHLELTNSLRLMLQALNKPSKYGLTLRTNEILHSLMNSTSSSNASKNRRRIMQGSGQQDAQEFFLILTETVEEEKKVLFEKLEKKREEKLGFRELLMPLELLDSLTRVVSQIESLCCSRPAHSDTCSRRAETIC